MKITNLKSKSLSLFAILFIVSLISACQGNEAYFRFEELKRAEWGRYDTLYYEIDSIETNKLHTVYLEVTNNVNYPYQNLWLFVQDNLPDSIFHEHKVECRLADESGKWIGAGFGSLYQSSFIYKTRVIFSDDRKNYRMKIVHGMRDELLTGIERVGVKIVKEE